MRRPLAGWGERNGFPWMRGQEEPFFCRKLLRNAEVATPMGTPGGVTSTTGPALAMSQKSQIATLAYFGLRS